MTIYELKALLLAKFNGLEFDWNKTGWDQYATVRFKDHKELSLFLEFGIKDGHQDYVIETLEVSIYHDSSDETIKTYVLTDDLKMSDDTVRIFRKIKKEVDKMDHVFHVQLGLVKNAKILLRELIVSESLILDIMISTIKHA